MFADSQVDRQVTEEAEMDSSTVGPWAVVSLALDLAN